MRIQYLVVEQSTHADRGTLFHLLPEAEVYHYRCLLSLAALPGDTQTLTDDGKPFTAAIRRVLEPPSFRFARADDRVPAHLVEQTRHLPLVVVLLAGQAPVWLRTLAEQRPQGIGILVPYHELAADLPAASFEVAEMRGVEDYRAFYRLLQQLIARLVASPYQFRAGETEALGVLACRDLFATRPRLGFLPPVALPQPWDGRAAAILLNRLSNNVDEPGLSPDRINDPTSLPNLLRLNWTACAVMAAEELDNQNLDATAVLSHDDRREAYRRLQDATGAEQQFAHWKDLMRRLAVGDKLSGGSVLLAVPAARTDLLIKNLPPTLRPDEFHSIGLSAMRKALKDFVRTESPTEAEATARGPKYETAWRTLLIGNRLISVQTALLGATIGASPIQVRDVGGALYAKVFEFRQAVSRGSRKAAGLFRELEIDLAKALPPSVAGDLARGHGPVLVYSDLPFEWANIEHWPLRMSRPVARIPIANGGWSTIANALEHPPVIDPQAHPRVLLIDLIPEHDEIRAYSEHFQSIGAAMGHRYEVKSPTTREALEQALADTDPQIVVLDTHGHYDAAKDRLGIQTPEGPVWVDEFLPQHLVPPVWILSACDTSVVGAIRGTLTRELILRGAVCVIASGVKVDAFTASVFCGRLLADIYSPPPWATYNNLAEVIFSAQSTTALLYDPLLPFFRRAERDPRLREPLGRAVMRFLRGVGERPLDPATHRVRAAYLLGESLALEGLQELQLKLASMEPLPETLFFTAFGAPSAISIATRGTQGVV